MKMFQHANFSSLPLFSWWSRWLTSLHPPKSCCCWHWPCCWHRNFSKPSPPPSAPLFLLPFMAHPLLVCLCIQDLFFLFVITSGFLENIQISKVTLFLLFLRYLWSQRVGHDWATGLIWSEGIFIEMNVSAAAKSLQSCFCSCPIIFFSFYSSVFILMFYLSLKFLFFSFLLSFTPSFLPSFYWIYSNCQAFYKQWLLSFLF